MTTDGERPRTRSAALAVFAVYTSAYFLSYFFRSTNAVIGPDLQRDVALDGGELGFMTGAFFLAFAAVQLPIGWALDRWGPRGVTGAGLLVAGLGSVLFAAGTSFVTLAASRMIIGAGMGTVLMGALTSFDRWFPGRSYRLASSLLVGLGSLGAVAAASPLAAATESVGWRNAFVLAAGFVVLAAIAVVVVDRARPGPSAGSSTEAMPSTPGRPEPSPAIPDYVVWRDSRLWALAGLNLFMSGLLFSIQGLWAGPFLYDTLSASAALVGVYLTVMSVGAAGGFTVAGAVANRFGHTRTTVAAASSLLVALGAIAVLPPPFLLVAYFVFGFSGAFNILLLTQARFIAPASHVGRAVTFVNLAGIGGGFLLQWLLGEVVDAFPATALGSVPKSAYVLALGGSAIGLAIALGVFVLERSRASRVAASVR